MKLTNEEIQSMYSDDDSPPGNDVCLGYIDKDCVRCGRHRVEKYESGIEVCEKCDCDQATGETVADAYYWNLL